MGISIQNVVCNLSFILQRQLCQYTRYEQFVFTHVRRCRGANYVCRGANYVCHGANYVCYGANYVCRGANYVCHGANYVYHA